MKISPTLTQEEIEEKKQIVPNLSLLNPHLEKEHFVRSSSLNCLQSYMFLCGDDL